MKRPYTLASVVLFVLAPGCVRQPVVAASNTHPAPPTVWERQVQNARSAGDGDYQLTQLQERVAAEPASVPARLELAQAYTDRGFPAVALEICRLAADRFPESGPAQLAVAKALRNLGRHEDAVRGLTAFLQGHPQTSGEYFAWLGILQDESGQWTAGELSHRRAIELAPAVDYFHNNLGYNLLMQQKDREAAAEFEAALKLNPASQLARNNLGLALAYLNAADQAVANWESGADPATAHNNLAAVWMEKGNYSEARKELAVALRYNRAHPAALRNLELVSRLDGTPATLDAPSQPNRRARWKTGLVRLFVGPFDDTRTGAGKAAPDTGTGEEQ